METSLLRWYYKRAIETLRYEGLQILLRRLVTMCLSPVGYVGVTLFCQKDLTQQLGEVRAKADLTVSQATEAEIEQLTTLVAKRYGPTKDLGPYKKQGIQSTILERFRRGCKCFVGKIGTEIIHYNWIFFHSEESVDHTGRFIHLKGDEALCNDAYTVEAWRGRAIHTAVHNQMLLFLQQAGYRKAYTAVSANNKSSQKTHHRLGWEFSGTMLYFIPRGAEKAWIWRLKGTLDPFVEEKIPAHEA